MRYIEGYTDAVRDVLASLNKSIGEIDSQTRIEMLLADMNANLDKIKNKK